MRKLMKMKRVVIVLAAIISLGALNTGAVFAEDTENEEVLEASAFDETLYNVLLKTLGTEKITKKLAQETESLDLQSSSLTSLEGIKNFENLKSLNLSSNALTTITELNSLTKLESLDLSKSGLKTLPDLTALKSLNPEKTTFVQNEIEYKQFWDNLPEQLLKADNYWLFNQFTGQEIEDPYGTIETSATDTSGDYFYYKAQVIKGSDMEVEEVTSQYTQSALKLDDDVMFRAFKVEGKWDDVPMQPISLILKVSQFKLLEGTEENPSIAEYDVMKIEGEEVYEKELNSDGDEITFTTNSSGIYVITCKNYIRESAGNGGGMTGTPKEKIKSGTAKSTPKETLKESPKTGDNTKSPYMYMLLIVLSSVAFFERFTWEMKARRIKFY